MGCGSSSQSGATTAGSSQPATQRQTDNRATSSKIETHEQQKAVPPPAANSSSGDEFLDNGIRAHNALRAKHGAVPLTPSADLTAFSQKWANHLAKIDNMEHSTNQMRKEECGGAGENLYMCWSSNPNAGVSADSAVQSWYDEIKDYNFSNQGFSMGTGHFTQVVWKGSKELGMAWAKTKGGSCYVVANYRPAGNYQGQFEDNVVPAS